MNRSHEMRTLSCFQGSDQYRQHTRICPAYRPFRSESSFGPTNKAENGRSAPRRERHWLRTLSIGCPLHDATSSFSQVSCFSESSGNLSRCGATAFNPTRRIVVEGTLYMPSPRKSCRQILVKTGVEQDVAIEMNTEFVRATLANWITNVRSCPSAMDLRQSTWRS